MKNKHRKIEVYIASIVLMLMSAFSVSASGLNTSTATAWSFSSGLNDWTTNNLSSPSYNNGGAVFAVTAGDPYMVSPLLANHSTTTYKRLRITMNSQYDSCGQIFFRRSIDGNFSEDRSIHFNIYATGQDFTYIIDLDENAYWSGQLVQLRIDLGGCSFTTSRNVRINSVELISDGPVNDDFDSAIYWIGDGPHNDTESLFSSFTSFAVDDPNPSCDMLGTASQTVWYRFHPSFFGTYRITNIGSSHSSTFSVWTGSRGNLSEAACSRNPTAGATELTFTGTTAQTYYVMVSGGYGTLQMQLQRVVNNPSSLAATVSSSSRINLSWTDNSNNEDRFYIEQSPNGSSSWSQIGYVTSNTTTYSNTGLSCGTTYYYRVRAWDNTLGYSSYSNIASNTTLVCPPSAPSGLSAVSASESQINLSWTDNSNNEDRFYIERSPNGSSSWNQIGYVLSNTTTYSNTGLSCGATYYFRVQAWNNSVGFSSYSNITNATLSCIPPAAPTNLFGVASDNQVNLSWTDNATSETAYVVERSPDNNTWLELTTLAADTTMYSDTTIACETTIYYRVRAYDSITDLYSGYSNVITATSAECPLTPPSSLYVIPNSETEIGVFWTDNANDETGYEIQHSTDATNWVTLNMSPADTISYIHPNLTCGTLHYYRVRTVRGGTVSDFTAQSGAMTLSCPLNPPTDFDASVTSTTQVTLTWQDQSTDETAFWVEQSTNGVDNWLRVTTLAANTTTHTVNNLNCNQTYYFRVQGFRETDSVRSNYSTTVSVTVPQCQLGAPSDLKLTNIASAQASIDWNDNSLNETQFRVERSIDGTDWYEIGTTHANDIIYTDDNITCETIYWYRVRAYRSTDSMFTDYSNVISVNTSICPPQHTDATVTLPNMLLQIGESDTISVNIDCQPDVGESCDAFDILVNFDATYYQVDQVSLGDLPGSTGNTVEILREDIDNTNGSIRIAWITYNNGNQSITGNGALLEITVTALVEGATPIQFADILGGAMDGNKIDVVSLDGIFTVAPVLIAPSNPRINETTSSYIELSWEEVNSATHYIVERSLQGANTWIEVNQATTETHFTDNTVDCNTGYDYRVMAYRQGDERTSTSSIVVAGETNLCEMLITITEQEIFNEIQTLLLLPDADWGLDFVLVDVRSGGVFHTTVRTTNGQVAEGDVNVTMQNGLLRFEIQVFISEGNPVSQEITTILNASLPNLLVTSLDTILMHKSPNWTGISTFSLAEEGIVIEMSFD